MRVQCRIRIEISAAPGESGSGWLKTNSQSLRRKIESLGYIFEPMGMGSYYLCTIVEDENSKKIELVREAILSEGYKEIRNAIIPKADRRSSFNFGHIREFSKSDLDQAEYLYLRVGLSAARIADWAYTSCDGYVLTVNRRLKSKSDFGWLDIITVPYVSENGKNQLECKDLVGLHCKPAIFDIPEKAPKQLYELSSTITMPPCLLPVQNGAGEVVAENWNEGERIWDEGGYLPPILKFRRVEVTCLGAFDIAKSRELIGSRSQHYRHQYIVSQRFREIVDAMKVRTVGFIPVELM
jgi:hypothetical protein